MDFLTFARGRDMSARIHGPGYAVTIDRVLPAMKPRYGDYVLRDGAGVRTFLDRFGASYQFFVYDIRDPDLVNHLAQRGYVRADAFLPRSSAYVTIPPMRRKPVDQQQHPGRRGMFEPIPLAPSEWERDPELPPVCMRRT